MGKFSNGILHKMNPYQIQWEIIYLFSRRPEKNEANSFIKFPKVYCVKWSSLPLRQSCTLCFDKTKKEKENKDKKERKKKERKKKKKSEEKKRKGKKDIERKRRKKKQRRDVPILNPSRNG